MHTRHIRIYIYSRMFMFFKMSLYRVRWGGMGESSEHIWRNAKTTKAETGKKRTHKEKLEGLQPDPLGCL